MVPDRGRTRGCRCRPGHSSSWYSSSWCLSHGELKKGTGTECGRRGESSARLSPEPCIFMHIQSIRRFRYYSSSTSHDALIFVVRKLCLPPHIDTVYGGVSVSNTSGALILLLLRVAPLYSYWYAIPSHYYKHAVPSVDYRTVTIHHYHYYADVAQVEGACTLPSITLYSLLLRLLY